MLPKSGNIRKHLLTNLWHTLKDMKFENKLHLANKLTCPPDIVTFFISQQFLYFPKDQNFYIPGGSFQDRSSVPSWRNMFENWSYLSYFPSLTQNINGTKNSEQHACWQVDEECLQLRHKLLNFLNIFGRLLSTDSVYFQCPDLCFILFNNKLQSLSRSI